MCQCVVLARTCCVGAQISDEKENVDRTHSDKKENVDRTRMPYGKVGTRWDFQTVWEGRNRYGYGKREAEKKKYYVPTPILMSDCDFTLVFIVVMILPLLYNYEGSLYPYFKLC